MHEFAISCYIIVYNIKIIIAVCTYDVHIFIYIIVKCASILTGLWHFINHLFTYVNSMH